jgi:hypothetical protein
MEDHEYIAARAVREIVVNVMYLDMHTYNITYKSKARPVTLATSASRMNAVHTTL